MKPCVEKSRHADTCYEDSRDHIREEMGYLDLLIEKRIMSLHLKRRDAPKKATFDPLSVSHEEADWLLRNEDSPTSGEEMTAVNRRIQGIRRCIDEKVIESANRGILLALPRLSRIFGLTGLESGTVIVCLAPELNRKYDRLYAYLQNDITRKRPSVDLVLDLLCETEEERWDSLPYFTEAGRLFRSALLEKIDDPQSPSGSSHLAQFLKLDARIFGYLLNNARVDARLIDLLEVVEASQTPDTVFIDAVLLSGLQKLVKGHFSGESASKKSLVLHFHGPYGVGRHELAGVLCRDLSCPMAVLDMELLPEDEAGSGHFLRMVYREALLLQSAVCLTNSDALTGDDHNIGGVLKRLFGIIAEYGGLTIMTGEKPILWKGGHDLIRFHSIGLTPPDEELAESAWLHTMGSSFNADSSWALQLSGRFRLTPGQIRDATDHATWLSCMGDKSSVLSLSDIYAACRQQSGLRLAELALRISPRQTWEELVLPESKIIQLKEICAQVRHRCLVLTKWGFGRMLPRGKGLSVLFQGPSGTGKTMAAEVIAHDLGLDLFKVDLSGLVSKYIGETEKNLARVFREAEASNTILFFDEADSLFGKRTEVSDAHDRYANIETSYLLQKMEEHEGIVILATNLRENMDGAFIRRIRFIIDFPLPDEAGRLRIWQIHFPKEAPLSEDIDFRQLAKHLQVAGGTVRNIALNAAFLAAGQGGVIGMEHLLLAARNEYEKIGKLWNHGLLRTAADPTGQGAL